MKPQFLFSLIVASALVGCGGIDGTLNVQQAFRLKDRKGDSHVIAAGSYKVNLNYKESKNRLSVSFDKLDGQQTTIEANTPKDFKMPDNGAFSLKAQDYGQEVDLSGMTKTAVTQSPNQMGTQSCQYTDWETVCVTDPHGLTACHQRPVSRPGYQEIWYYDETTDQTLTADFTNPDTSAVVAHVNAHAAYTQRHITSTGICGW